MAEAGRSQRKRAGPSPEPARTCQLDAERLLVLGRVLNVLTSLLDSLTGRRGGIGGSLSSCVAGSVNRRTSRVHRVAGRFHGGIASGSSGITGGLGGLASGSGSLGGGVLSGFNGFLLGAARNGQGGKGSGKSDLGVHQNVPRVMSMDV